MPARATAKNLLHEDAFVDAVLAGILIAVLAFMIFTRLNSQPSAPPAEAKPVVTLAPQQPPEWL